MLFLPAIRLEAIYRLEAIALRLEAIGHRYLDSTPFHPVSLGPLEVVHRPALGVLSVQRREGGCLWCGATIDVQYIKGRIPKNRRTKNFAVQNQLKLNLLWLLGNIHVKMPNLFFLKHLRIDPPSYLGQ